MVGPENPTKEETRNNNAGEPFDFVFWRPGFGLVGGVNCWVDEDCVYVECIDPVHRPSGRTPYGTRRAKRKWERKAPFNRNSI